MLFEATVHLLAPLVALSLDFSVKIHGEGIGSAFPATHGGLGLPVGHVVYWMF
jgi:hypothetical protein